MWTTGSALALAQLRSRYTGHSGDKCDLVALAIHSPCTTPYIQQCPLHSEDLLVADTGYSGEDCSTALLCGFGEDVSSKTPLLRRHTHSLRGWTGQPWKWSKRRMCPRSRTSWTRRTLRSLKRRRAGPIQWATGGECALTPTSLAIPTRTGKPSAPEKVSNASLPIAF